LSLPGRTAAAFLFIWASAGHAQYIISTIAGGGLPAVPALAVASSIASPKSVAIDTFGNQYFLYDNGVFEASIGGVLTRIAGLSAVPGFSGDGGPAILASFNGPTGIAVDPHGNVYVADTGNARIRKFTVGGIVSTIAGNGQTRFSGDGGPAVDAEFDQPGALAADSAGDLFIVDNYNYRIRKIAADGSISTVAGNGTYGYSGDGGPATGAELSFFPTGLAVDSAGDLYIADTNNSRIRKVSNGIISTVAGDGAFGYSGDGAPALNAEFSSPTGVAVDQMGNIYIADFANARIREVALNGIISTVAGNGYGGYSGDGGPAVSATLYGPWAIAIDSFANLYFADSYNNAIRKFTVGGTISTVVGNGTDGYFGDGGPANAAGISGPYAVALDSTGNLYITETGNCRVRKVAVSGIISTFAGSIACGYSGDGGPASSAELFNVQGLVIDNLGNVFIADSDNSRIRKVGLNGLISTIAGTGLSGYSGDGGPATSAQISAAGGMALDSSGNLYFADSANYRIREVAVNGTISTVAGNGIFGYSGDGGLATNAELGVPIGVAIDSAGNLYIGDGDNARVRKVAAGGISTYAGDGIYGYAGDGGPATSAEIGLPTSVALDDAGDLFITDADGQIREVSPGGTISTVAGVNVTGYSGDGGLAASAKLDFPQGAIVSPSGALYFADAGNNVIRELVPVSSSALLTISSTHTGGFFTGQTGNTYSLGVSNNSLAGPTVGAVTVTELTPNGLTFVSMAGNGWNCSSNVCARSDVLAPGAAYPPLTLVVDVSSNAPASLVNQATVTGGGSFAAAADDLTVVAPCLAVTPASISVDTTGGSPQVIAITAAASNCAWTAATTSSWIQISSLSGTGSGTSTVTIPPNTTGADLAGFITIGPFTIPVTQRFTAQVFSDVAPGYYDFDAVNLLSTEGITTGCSPTDFCPTANIIRSQMAIFIIRAIFHTDNFPYSTMPVFSDVPAGSFGFQWIQKMAELGITQGCATNLFCPNDQVTRDQMAVFLIRMRYGASYNFDYPSTPYFTDVGPASFGWSWIQRLKEDNITSGCTATTFCPTNPVSRGDMATFVMRGAFNQLLPAGEPVLLSISPTTIVHGADPEIFTLTGLNTNFVDGVTSLGAIPEITVGTVSVISATTLTVQLSASSSAALEPVSPLAITGIPPGNEEAVLPNGLVVQ